jgi:GNAT superfamily N-acetyltransferase
MVDLMLPCDVEYPAEKKESPHYIVDIIPFLVIHSIWKEKLWPNRESAIRPVSSMKRGGGYDMTIYSASPVFLGVVEAKNRKNVIAVNSFFKTGTNEYRSRGLWVDPDYRSLKIGKMIMADTIKRVHQLNSLRNTVLWTIPRQSAMPFYESCGFVRTSDWFDEGMEFGPNAYAEQTIKRCRK